MVNGNANVQVATKEPNVRRPKDAPASRARTAPSARSPRAVRAASRQARSVIRSRRACLRWTHTRARVWRGSRTARVRRPGAAARPPAPARPAVPGRLCPPGCARPAVPDRLCPTGCARPAVADRLCPIGRPPPAAGGAIASTGTAAGTQAAADRPGHAGLWGLSRSVRAEASLPVGCADATATRVLGLS